MEGAIKRYCARSGTHAAVVAAPSEVLSVYDTPQKVDGTDDSGPVVCYLMDCLVHNAPIGTYRWTVKKAGMYRAHMVRSFAEAIMRRVITPTKGPPECMNSAPN